MAERASPGRLLRRILASRRGGRRVADVSETRDVTAGSAAAPPLESQRGVRRVVPGDWVETRAWLAERGYRSLPSPLVPGYGRGGIVFRRPGHPVDFAESGDTLVSDVLGRVTVREDDGG